MVHYAEEVGNFPTLKSQARRTVDARGLLDIATLVIAGYAAALATYTYRREKWRDTANLRITPQIARVEREDGESIRLCFEITNLSPFEVTVQETGFYRWPWDRTRAYFPPLVLDGHGFPIRMLPRATVTVFLKAGTETRERFSENRRVYVRTACGAEATGRNGALRWFVKNLPASEVPDDLDPANPKGRPYIRIITSQHGLPKTRF